VAERPRLDMAQVFRARGAAFRRSHVLKAHQWRALLAVERCRTEALGGHLDEVTVQPVNWRVMRRSRT